MKAPHVMLYLMSMVVCGISGISILGHIRHKPFLYTWYALDVGMALPTATCLLLTGAAVFILTVLVSHKGATK